MAGNSLDRLSIRNVSTDPYTIVGDGNFLPSSSSLTQTVNPSLFVLNPSTSGALTLSGIASIHMPGIVVVDSSSRTALTESGNASLTAAAIDVVGGVQRTGNATLSPAPVTISAAADPLGALAAPTGGTAQGSVNLSGRASMTINPGIYSQISVSGNASLTLNPGVYILQGSGLTVTGNASISGSGVMLYNTGSNFPNPGGNFGGITLSGNGSCNLSAATTGTYAGVLIFQSRANTRALSLSGNALSGMGGTIYAASAQLTLSGNAQVAANLVVNTLNLSGNVSLTQMAAGSDGSGDVAGIADTLLAGDLEVYVDNSSGSFTTDELARIQDAVDGWNALLVPYNVSITEVTDPASANIVVDANTTSACGAAADGVLGCYNGAASEITLLQGWNWYAGADPSQVGADQYDFQTTVTHELGHALGLGGGNDPNSPMDEILPAGVSHRTMTAADLNIPEAPVGADPLTASSFGNEDSRGALHRIVLGQEPMGLLVRTASIMVTGSQFLVPNSPSVLFVAAGSGVGNAVSVGGDALSWRQVANLPEALGKLATCLYDFPSEEGASCYPAADLKRASVPDLLEATRKHDEGPRENDLPRGDVSDRALVDEVMRQLATTAATASTPSLNVGEALLAVVGVEWFLWGEPCAAAAEKPHRKRIDPRERQQLKARS